MLAPNPMAGRTPLHLKLLAMGAAAELADELETALTSVANDPDASSRMSVGPFSSPSAPLDLDHVHQLN